MTVNCPFCGRFLTIYRQKLKPFYTARSMSTYVSEYLCGNCEMVFKYDGYDWVKKRDILVEIEV